MSYYHKSVLAKEAIDFLNVNKNQLYIDATAGGGGHTKEIVKRGGQVLALDRDPASIGYLKSLNLKNTILKEANFSHIYNIAHKFGFKKVSGIIFDLGLSSAQIEDTNRGFSFLLNSPLDMRMDPNISLSAFEIINHFEKRRLNEIFHKFGQEKFSWPIADAICSARKIKPVRSTGELSKIVNEVYQKHKVRSKTNPATKVFQALRIVVNSELLNLKEALPQTTELLEKNGRLVIISFHSLEDAIVKRFFKEQEKLLTLTKKPIG
ncbi:16S rRNA (cytosine(1402)-N(4))-methyltransferase, partial [Candidatus Curtissbacteria bacterium RBG_13_35_7]